MNAPNHPQPCKNCGHDRKDHSFDDSCWHEVETDGWTRLCMCKGFEPVPMLIDPKPNQPARL